MPDRGWARAVVVYDWFSHLEVGGQLAEVLDLARRPARALVRHAAAGALRVASQRRQAHILHLAAQEVAAAALPQNCGRAPPKAIVADGVGR